MNNCVRWAKANQANFVSAASAWRAAISGDQS